MNCSATLEKHCVQKLYSKPAQIVLDCLHPNYYYVRHRDVVGRLPTFHAGGSVSIPGRIKNLNPTLGPCVSFVCTDICCFLRRPAIVLSLLCCG